MPDSAAPRGRAAETSQTLDRGIRLLELLGETTGGHTVTELAAELGVARTVVYRLLATLEEHGLVRRSGDGQVRLGLGVLQLARRVQPLLREAALPVLRALAEDVGATAHLTIVDGPDALALAVVEPTWTDVHVAYRVGSRHPLDRGAAGRAILLARRPGGGEPAGLPVADAGRDAPCSARDVPSYVASEGELQPGAYGVAAAVRGLAAVEASVGVVALSALNVSEVGPKVVAAADAMAARLR